MDTPRNPSPPEITVRSFQEWACAKPQKAFHNAARKCENGSPDMPTNPCCAT